jgi:hypothetical protein
MTRAGQTVTVVNSPYSVTATPFIQDEQYHIAGGLR